MYLKLHFTDCNESKILLGERSKTIRITLSIWQQRNATITTERPAVIISLFSIKTFEIMFAIKTYSYSREFVYTARFLKEANNVIFVFYLLHQSIHTRKVTIFMEWCERTGTSKTSENVILVYLSALNMVFVYSSKCN